MPDPTLQTLSATETPALWGLSPYVTRWMLYRRFVLGVAVPAAENARMSWGKKLQPLVIAQSAEDLGVEVRPNPAQTYQRRGRLGCTRDAVVFCRRRGPGALETKCVFDYATWMREWGGGRSVPPMHEIQLQQQMLVGDERGSYAWGVIGAWVAGEMHYFERRRNDELWRQLEQEAEAFFEAVAAKREPDPSGAVVEVRWLAQLLPTVAGKRLDLSQDPAAGAIAEKATQYKVLLAHEHGARRAKEKLRAELLAMAGQCEEVVLPGGVRVRVSTRGVAGQKRSKTLTVVKT